MNYFWIDSYLIKEFSPKETVVVQRIIDGDTIEIENKTSVRLLGINTPEKGEKYYQEAKNFLENLVLNKTIGLEAGREDKDKYQRELRYVFLNGENINVKLIEQGFANSYFPSGKDKYSEEFYQAWERCLIKNVNLCEKSKDKCGNCIELKSFNYKNGEIVIYNKCSFDCDLNNWLVKAEGRKKIILNKTIENKKELKISEEDIWTDSGDSLFLRDENGKLVLYYPY